MPDASFSSSTTEHTPVDWEKTAAMILAAEAAGATSIVRLPTWGRERITKALDAGADGVMIPQVEDGWVTGDVVAATTIRARAAPGAQPPVATRVTG